MESIGPRTVLKQVFAHGPLTRGTRVKGYYAWACSQRQFVDIKQRYQHPNKFTRRLTEYCAIDVLQLSLNPPNFVPVLSIRASQSES